MPSIHAFPCFDITGAIMEASNVILFVIEGRLDLLLTSTIQDEKTHRI